MTIALLKQSPGQKIPRPFNRVTGRGEAIEVLVYHSTNGQGFSARKKAMEHAAVAPDTHAAALGLAWNNLNTDKPVLVLGRDKFYAFTEE